jgi:hypothetical protein
MFVKGNLNQFRNASADVQMFYEDSTWNKPRGCSQVYMLLIGGGGNGSLSQGGGSGAVTCWWGAAQHVPDSLFVSVSTGNASNSTVNYRGTGGLVALLTASGASTTTGASAMSSNFFGASGFFNSVAGQNGGTASVTASTTTFLSGGADTTGDTVTANYGYTTPASGNGNFFLQPIMVGLGGSAGGRGGIGCGSGRSGVGGSGLVIIASW